MSDEMRGKYIVDVKANTKELEANLKAFVSEINRIHPELNFDINKTDFNDLEKLTNKILAGFKQLKQNSNIKVSIQNINEVKKAHEELEELNRLIKIAQNVNANKIDIANFKSINEMIKAIQVYKKRIEELKKVNKDKSLDSNVYDKNLAEILSLEQAVINLNKQLNQIPKSKFTTGNGMDFKMLSEFIQQCNTDFVNFKKHYQELRSRKDDNLLLFNNFKVLGGQLKQFDAQFASTAQTVEKKTKKIKEDVSSISDGISFQPIISELERVQKELTTINDKLKSFQTEKFSSLTYDIEQIHSLLYLLRQDFQQVFHTSETQSGLINIKDDIKNIVTIISSIDIDNKIVPELKLVNKEITKVSESLGKLHQDFQTVFSNPSNKSGIISFIDDFKQLNTSDLTSFISGLSTLNQVLNKFNDPNFISEILKDTKSSTEPIQQLTEAYKKLWEAKRKSLIANNRYKENPTATNYEKKIVANDELMSAERNVNQVETSIGIIDVEGKLTSLFLTNNQLLDVRKQLLDDIVKKEEQLNKDITKGNNEQNNLSQLKAYQQLLTEQLKFKENFEKSNIGQHVLDGNPKIDNEIKDVYVEYQRLVHELESDILKIKIDADSSSLEETFRNIKSKFEKLNNLKNQLDLAANKKDLIDTDEEISDVIALKKAYAELTDVQEMLILAQYKYNKNQTAKNQEALIRAQNEVKAATDQVNNIETKTGATLEENNEIYQERINLQRQMTSAIAEYSANIDKVIEKENKYEKINEIEKNFSDIEKYVDKLETGKYGDGLKFGWYNDGIVNQYKVLKDTINEISSSVRALDVDMDTSQLEAEIQRINTLLNEAKVAQSYLKDTKNYKNSTLISATDLSTAKARQIAFEKLKNSIVELDNATVSFNEDMTIMSATIRNSSGDLETFRFKADKTAGSIEQMSTKIEGKNNGFSKSISSISKKFQDVIKYFGASTVIYGLFNQFKNGISIIKEFDSAMTELRKVTNLTEIQYQNFEQTAAHVGRSIGRTMTEVASATADFSRLGYNIDEATNLAEKALIMTNIGDGIALEDATSAIVSTLKGFKMDVTAEDVAVNSQKIIDSINNVSNNFALSTQDIADAIQKMSAVLNQGGTTFDETVGMFTAGMEVMQDTSKVSHGLITISQRIRGISDEGEDLSDLQPKLEKQFNKMGLTLLDTHGELKSTYDILNELSAVWDQQSSQMQQYVGELMAGKNQISVLQSTLQNWSAAQRATNASINSTGSALRENEAALDSIQGKIQQFKAQLEIMWNQSLNDSTIKWVIDLGTSALETATNLGLIPTAITAITAAIGLLNADKNILSTTGVTPGIA